MGYREAIVRQNQYILGRNIHSKENKLDNFVTICWSFLVISAVLNNKPYMYQIWAVYKVLMSLSPSSVCPPTKEREAQSVKLQIG